MIRSSTGTVRPWRRPAAATCSISGRESITLRPMPCSPAELARKVKEMEKQYNSQFQEVFTAIRALMAPPDPDPPAGARIGF